MDGNPKTGELPNGGGIAGSQLLEWTSPDILLNDAFDAARCDFDAPFFKAQSNALLLLGFRNVLSKFFTRVF